MLDYEKILLDPRQTLAFTGMTSEEISALLPNFEELLKNSVSEKKTKLGKRRKRKIGGGNKPKTLKTPLSKLFFTLFYMKGYPTFDIMGGIFEMDRTCTCRWVHQLVPLVKKALKMERVLPVRVLHSQKEFVDLNQEAAETAVDGFERQVQRSSNNEEQAQQYSGKKKLHTEKHQIVIDRLTLVILIVSPADYGSMHDYTQSKRRLIIKRIPNHIVIFVDLGYLGIEKDNPRKKWIYIPHKKPKGGKLTKEQKKYNRYISSLRVPIEHTIGKIRRMNCMTHRYRNRKIGFNDLMVETVCGLWNFHLLIKGKGYRFNSTKELASKG